MIAIPSISRRLRAVAAAAALALFGFGAAVQPAAAKSAAEINAGVAAALAELRRQPGAARLLDQAVAVLVIPEVTKAGLVIGGAYGEGALLVGGATRSYWSYAAASIGYQIGAQRTRQVLLFMTQQALDGFAAREGVEIGADLEVTVIDSGAEAAIDTTEETAPVIGYVYGRTGLLAGASLQGGKYTRIFR